MKVENRRFVFPGPQKRNIRFMLKFLCALLLRLFYRVLFLFIKGDDKKAYQHEVSICAIFKNEAPYLREWLEYHRLIGIQHFYLYNNNSEDEFLEVLQNYINEGTVTLTDWPENQAQMKAYSDCIVKRRSESHWIAFIDLDEFIVPVHNDSIVEWVQKFRNRPSIKLYWKVFGTSGLVDRDLHSLVIESFTSCWNKMDMVGKCILNNDFTIDDSGRRSIFHHNLWAKWHGVSMPPVNCFDHICLYNFEWAGTDDFPIFINHYFTKSYKEYLAKAGKGDVFFKENPHDMEYFWEHERRCIKKDYTICKYLTKLKLTLNRTTKQDI